MDLTNSSVRETFRSDLYDPTVIELALSTLEARLTTASDDSRVATLESEQRLRTELARLTAALAAGGSWSSLLFAIRERKHWRSR